LFAVRAVFASIKPEFIKHRIVVCGDGESTRFTGSESHPDRNNDGILEIYVCDGAEPGGWE